MSDLQGADLIFDWNARAAPPRPAARLQFDDETLRDGLQSPSVHTPSLDEKKRLVELMDRLGIDTADIGLPGAGGTHARDVAALAAHIAARKLRLGMNCAARTVVADLEPVARIAQQVGREIEVCTFIGSSPIRMYAEGWTIEKMLEVSKTALDFARRENLPVMFVTEDTTRAKPEHLKALYGCAIEAGAKRLCLCDTVGHATPRGVRALVEFVREEIVRPSGAAVGLDWHGHRDRGLDLENTIAAIEAGCDRVHGAALGIGERCGNTPMDLLLVNLHLMGWIDNDLTALSDYVDLAARATRRPLPVNYPVFGPDAFETGTGVHAAAVIKALQKGDHWLADRVYSGVPAGDFGRRQKVSIGPMSGRSNVIFWLTAHEYAADNALVDHLFALAKESPRMLAEGEIHGAIAAFRGT